MFAFRKIDMVHSPTMNSFEYSVWIITGQSIQDKQHARIFEIFVHREM